MYVHVYLCRCYQTFPKWIYQFAFSPGLDEASFALHLCQLCQLIRLLNFATWMDIQYYFPIVWIFTYHYLSVIKLSSFSYVDNAVFSQCGMSVHIFCPFLYMIICLLIDFQSYLHFSNTDPLSVCNLYFSCFIMFILNSCGVYSHTLWFVFRVMFNKRFSIPKT